MGLGGDNTHTGGDNTHTRRTHVGRRQDTRWEETGLRQDSEGVFRRESF